MGFPVGEVKERRTTLPPTKNVKIFGESNESPGQAALRATL